MNKNTYTKAIYIPFLFTSSTTIDIQGIGKIMEILRSWGIEFMLATLKEIQSATLNVLLPFVSTL
jgi:hypothetical protein